MPSICPSCKSKIVRPEGEAAWRCINAACPAQTIERVFHFASKEAMDIEGLGGKLAKQLIEKKLINDPADIFYLTKEKLLSLELMADKRAQNLLDAIEASKQRELPNIILALGIFGIGETAARPRPDEDSLLGHAPLQVLPADELARLGAAHGAAAGRER